MSCGRISEAAPRSMTSRIYGSHDSPPEKAGTDCRRHVVRSLDQRVTSLQSSAMSQSRHSIEKDKDVRVDDESLDLQEKGGLPPESQFQHLSRRLLTLGVETRGFVFCAASWPLLHADSHQDTASLCRRSLGPGISQSFLPVAVGELQHPLVRAITYLIRRTVP